MHTRRSFATLGMGALASSCATLDNFADGGARLRLNRRGKRKGGCKRGARHAHAQRSQIMRSWIAGCHMALPDWTQARWAA